MPMRVPFRNVDASWLRMDDPTNLMVVTGVLVLESPVPLARLRALVEERLLRFRRFTSRVVPPFAGVGLPSWEIDPRWTGTSSPPRSARAPGSRPSRRS